MLKKVKSRIPGDIGNALFSDGIIALRPAQLKAVEKGLLDNKSLLVCTPTASGKTLIAEMAASVSIGNSRGKAIYVVPLKALASEKHREFTRKYSGLFRIALAVGDPDSEEPHLVSKDFIICTSEKLDSIIRHYPGWLKSVNTLIVDEIHLLNDPSRGPTLEVIITIMRSINPKLQIIGLSATIGNPEELAEWLGAGLVVDQWRPVRLRKGIYLDGAVEFYD